MHERRDFIDVLIADHGAAEQVFAEIDGLASEPQTAETLGEIRRLTDRVIAELMRHSVAEEEHVYPAARTRLADGPQIAEKEIAEHARAEETMKVLAGMSPSNLDYLTTVRTLAHQIREHAGQEEADLLPALAATLSSEERLQLGEQIEQAKASASTHPRVPSR